MEWRDIASTIGKAAPMLGTLISGPAGAAVGGMIASALGTDASPDQVALAIKDPDALVKIKQIEVDHSEKLQALMMGHIETLAKVDAGDRADARGMLKATGSNVPATLAILVTLGFFSILGVMLAGIWKPQDNQALLILLGALGTSWGAVVNFYFGSSVGSARKDELLANSSPFKQPLSYIKD